MLAIDPSRRRLTAHHRPTAERLGLEHLCPKADAEVGELLGELRAHTGGLQVAHESTLVVDAHTEVEEEDVLEGDDVSLHALDLGDVRDSAGAIT